MTCIVGWRSKWETVVGTDSQWTQGNTKGTMPKGKLWRNGRFLIAAAGSVRAMQVLEYGPQFNPDIKDEALVEHLITKWVPAIVSAFNDAGALMKKDTETAMVEVEAIICCRRKFIRFGGDLTIIEEPLRYVAGGSGEEVALGYMAAHDTKQGRDRSALSVVQGALRAAELHCTGVRGPYHMEVVK